MTIAGPKIQMPPAQTAIVDESQRGTVDWINFYHALKDTLFATTRNGPTSSRPTSTMPGRYIGMEFFDTTLGKPVFLKIASTSVWVDGQGNVV